MTDATKMVEIQARLNDIERPARPSEENRAYDEFMAHAPGDLRWLLSEVRRLTEEREAVIAAIYRDAHPEARELIDSGHATTAVVVGALMEELARLRSSPPEQTQQ